MYVIAPDGASRRSCRPDEARRSACSASACSACCGEAAGATQVIGEDLGVVPRFRARLARAPRHPRLPRAPLGDADDGVFRDPATYPARSVATSGTHDTSSLAVWWEEELDADGPPRARGGAGVRRARGAAAAFTPAVHEALLDGLYAAGSDLVGRSRSPTPTAAASGSTCRRRSARRTGAIACRGRSRSCETGAADDASRVARARSRCATVAERGYELRAVRRDACR